MTGVERRPGHRANQDLLERLGVFVRRGFLPRELRGRLAGDAVSGERSPAPVVRGSETIIDQRARRSRRVALEPARLAAVTERLEALRPSLAEHFGEPMGALQPPQLLVYRTGDFFRAHQDTGRIAPGYARRRRVSVIAFVNGQSERPAEGAFCGGSLRLFRLRAEATPQDVRTPVLAEPGLAVAFRSELFHEVTQISAGERFSVVAFFE